MTPLNLVGMSFACFGLAGLSLAMQACNELIAIPHLTGNQIDWPVLCAMGFIVLVNMVIIVVGMGVAVFDLSAMGGLHG